MTAYRLPAGGAIDRDAPISFVVDGRRLGGFEGDTLASALLAQNIWLMGRSFKRHRPRGPMSAGVEEPNALFTVGVGGREEPNSQATRVALYDGLVARSQNHWPSLSIDAGALLDRAAPLLPAGFYYKTFKWPPFAWPLYERIIRSLAGLGPAPSRPDPDDYAERHAHTDLIVIGLGVAGLAAARAGVEAGLSVMVVEQASTPALDLSDITINGADAKTFFRDQIAALRSDGAKVLFKTTAFGLYDHGLIGAVERLVAPGEAPAPGAPAQRLWRIRARNTVLATGAIERPLAFTDNDRPGIMLASAAVAYAQRYGVAVGESPVIVTAGNSGYRSAVALSQMGVRVTSIFDLRPKSDIPDVALDAAATIGARVNSDVTAVNPRGVACIDGVVVAHKGGGDVRVSCDALLVSGGWTPTVHLHAQSRSAMIPDRRWRAMVPARTAGAIQSVGACAGTDGVAACWREGWLTGQAVAESHGLRIGDNPSPAFLEPALGLAGGVSPILPQHDPKRTFVDLQNDVTIADIALAVREGYDATEHAKRYTTLGMGADQGKTSGVIGLQALANARGDEGAILAPTTYRPPFTPVTLGALAAGRTGGHVAPTRRSPLHAVFEAEGAVFQTSGHWLRPRAFPRDRETGRASAVREARAVRSAVGIADASTLGKIWIEGPQATALLESVYANPAATCAVGRARYAFLLSDDGAVHDDGVLQRWRENGFLLTTSTVRLADILARLEYFRDVVLGGLDADICDVTEAWSGAIVAGPMSVQAISAALPDADLPAPQGLTTVTFRGRTFRIARVSYSGERAYEIYAPPDSVVDLWRRLVETARGLGGAPYGLDALDWLRIEKGHIAVGAEIDGRATARDLGLSRWARKAGGYAGAVGAARPAMKAAGRLELVGLKTMSGTALDGAVLTDSTGAACGHVTSTGYGVGIEAPVALGFVRDGRTRYGERLAASAPTRRSSAEIVIVSPCRFDPEGVRTHGG